MGRVVDVCLSPTLERGLVVPLSLCVGVSCPGLWPHQMASGFSGQSKFPCPSDASSSLWLSALWEWVCPRPGAQCGVDLVSLALGSLLSKDSLGLAEGEAAALAFLH